METLLLGQAATFSVKISTQLKQEEPETILFWMSGW